MSEWDWVFAVGFCRRNINRKYFSMMSYFLKKGMSIGKSDGVIREIKNGSVVVEEKTYDVSGDLQTKLVTLGLHKSETED